MQDAAGTTAVVDGTTVVAVVGGGGGGAYVSQPASARRPMAAQRYLMGWSPPERFSHKQRADAVAVPEGVSEEDRDRRPDTLAPGRRVFGIESAAKSQRFT
jgi:hypothetical protein